MEMNELKDAIEQYQAVTAEGLKTFAGRLDDIEKYIVESETKANRPRLGGSSESGALESPDQRKALERGIRALLSGNHVAAETCFAELKAMSVGADPEGGYLVTPTFSTEMTRIMLEISPFLELARTVPIESDSFEEPVDNEAAGADWVGEVQARGETATPKLKMFYCPVHEIQAEPAITQKLIDTARLDVVAWLQGKVAEKFAHTETVAFFNGNGVNKPTGFLSYPTEATSDATRAWGKLEHVKTGAAGVFAATNPADALIDLVSKLKPQYRNGAVWMMNRITAALVQKMKDAEGRYIWLQSILPGQPNSLLGYPVTEAEQMPDPATDSLSIAFGNFSKGYTIVRRLGVRFLLDPYTKKPFVKLYTYNRVGGDVNNFEAIKLLKFSA